MFTTVGLQAQPLPSGEVPPHTVVLAGCMLYIVVLLSACIMVRPSHLFLVQINTSSLLLILWASQGYFDQVVGTSWWMCEVQIMAPWKGQDGNVVQEPVSLRAIVAASAAATLLYTPVLKRICCVKNAVVAATIAASPLAGGLASGQVRCLRRPPQIEADAHTSRFLQMDWMFTQQALTCSLCPRVSPSFK